MNFHAELLAIRVLEFVIDPQLIWIELERIITGQCPKINLDPTVTVQVSQLSYEVPGTRKN